MPQTTPDILENDILHPKYGEAHSFNDEIHLEQINSRNINQYNP